MLIFCAVVLDMAGGLGYWVFWLCEKKTGMA
jgi:hypothetical protein